MIVEAPEAEMKTSADLVHCMIGRAHKGQQGEVRSSLGCSSLGIDFMQTDAKNRNSIPKADCCKREQKYIEKKQKYPKEIKTKHYDKPGPPH